MNCIKKITNFLSKFSLILYCAVFLVGCETVKKTYEVLSNPDVRVGDRLDQPSEFMLSIYATHRINVNPHSDNEDDDDDEEAFNEEMGDKDFSDDENFDDTESGEDDEVITYDKDSEDEDFTDDDFNDNDDNSEDMSDKDDNEDGDKAKQKKKPKKRQQKKVDEHLIKEEEKAEEPQATPVLLRIVQLSEKSLFLSSTYDELLDDKLEKTLGKNYLEHQELMIDPSQFRYIDKTKMKEGTRYIGVIAYFNDENDKQWRDIIKVKPNGEIYPLLIRISENAVRIYKDN